jgi:predicted ribosome quality control (RQC) complex YloA/Tae2 family protein
LDNLILEALVAELRPRLVGWPVFRAVAPDPESLLLLFDDPVRSRLLISASASRPRLHLTQRRVPARGAEETPFSRAAAHHLTGAVVAAIEKAPAERIVRLRFAGAGGPEEPGKSLVAELLGRSSNLLLLDPGGAILGAAKRLKSAFRAPIVGEPYVPPPASHRRDPASLGAEEIQDLVRQAEQDSRPLADLLLEVAPALGTLAAHEVEGATRRGENPHDVLTAWLDRARGGAAAAPGAARSGSEGSEPGEAVPAAAGYIHADEPPESMGPASEIPRERFLLTPIPLESAPAGLRLFPYATLNRAAEVYFEALEGAARFRERLRVLAEIARREERKADGIARKVAGDLEALRSAGRYRHFGEALLAGLTRAARRGDSVTVPDPYDPGEAPMTIAVDPALSLQANADRYFARHRKAERGKAVAEKRLLDQTRRAEVMRSLQGRTALARTEEDLVAIEEALRVEGLAVGIARRGRTKDRGPAPAAAPEEVGARIYRSCDGYEILVGKGGDENDRLTFRIASPEDWWLHASEAAGAHVIVRARRPGERPPAGTLQEAAELAAFYSKAKGAGRADVMLTRRKYVRRIRGAPRGTVTVKKHETLSVVPRHPFE